MDPTATKKITGLEFEEFINLVGGITGKRNEERKSGILTILQRAEMREEEEF